MQDPMNTTPDKGAERKAGRAASKKSIPGSGLPKGRPARSNVDITAMIRSLQRTEGSRDCFRRGIADCDQLNCSWRQYCLCKTD